MSEKRFELVEAICYEVGKQQIEIMDNLEKQIVEKQKVVDLLNSLSKENEQLKQEVKQYWKYRDVRKQKIKDLEKENEQLKSTIIHLEEECGARENDYVNLKKQLDKIPKNIRRIWLNG